MGALKRSAPRNPCRSPPLLDFEDKSSGHLHTNPKVAANPSLASLDRLPKSRNLTTSQTRKTSRKSSLPDFPKNEASPSPHEKRTLDETGSPFDLLKLEAKPPIEHQRPLKKRTPIPDSRPLAKTIRNLTRDPLEGKTRTNSRQTDGSLQPPRHHSPKSKILARSCRRCALCSAKKSCHSELPRSSDSMTAMSRQMAIVTPDSISCSPMTIANTAFGSMTMSLVRDSDRTR